ncbi:MAG: Asp23/Gls24 family envelope stress response protein [Microcella sp.]
MTPLEPDRTPTPPAEDGDGDGIGATGYDLAALGEYLDRDCQPPIPAIDESPECQAALDRLRRVRSLSRELVDDDARQQPPLPVEWVRGLLAGLELDVRAGRDIPFGGDDPATRLSITEGAVREVVRGAGDAVPGVLVGGVTLDGDVTTPGAAIGVELRISVALVEPIPDIAEHVRARVTTALLSHTELHVTRIDVTVDDVHVVSREETAR